MGWNKKRQLIWYQINDSEAIARHMEKMAAKGWYPTEQAEQNKISSVKQKFSAQ